jgi:hypothetical protein
MPVLHEVNNIPTQEKFDTYDKASDIYYRFQDKKYEMGTQSWGMIYSSPEEAIEDGSDVLNGKSCCSTARKARGFALEFDNDSVVMVLKGWFVEVGHDDEDVIDVEEVLEIWSREDFMAMF